MLIKIEQLNGALTLERPDEADVAIVESVVYEPSGPLATVEMENDPEESRPYNTRYFPQAVSITNGSAALLDWQYTTDAEGNILGIADVLDPANNRTYTYQDVQYFLTTGNGPWGNLSWTYDHIGNRLSETRDGTTDVYSYVPNLAAGNSAKLQQITRSAGGVQSFTYDAAGNQTQTAEGIEIIDRTYDVAGRLASQDQPAADSASSFFYDGRSFLC